MGHQSKTRAGRDTVIGRELTKMYGEFLLGTPKSLLAHFKAYPPKGEMVVLFNQRMRDIHDDDEGKKNMMH